MSKYKAMAFEILAKNGIKDLKPNEWYPQQAWLDAFKSISETIGPFTLCIIGKKIPENAQWPPEINEIHAALSSIDIAYHMNHRIDDKILFNPETGEMSEGIGHYKYTITSETTGTMVCNNPYPCDFDRGIINEG